MEHRPSSRAIVQSVAMFSLVGMLATMAACNDNSSPPAAQQSSTKASNAAGASSRTGTDPCAYLPKVPSFSVVSTTIKNGQPLPTAQMSGLLKVPGGKDTSPQLSWSGFPAQTKSFAVTMYDPQAPTGSGFWHWIVGDIPSTTTSLPVGAGALNSTMLPAGVVQLGGDAGTRQYVGAAPPAGSGIHNYYITVSALDVPKSGVGADGSSAFFGFNIAGHTIARATLICPTEMK